MTCLIIGGTSGIGYATALQAARAGYPVAIVGRRATREADELLKCLCASGHAIAITADVTSEDEIVNAFDQAERRLGPIGSLVNAAGAPYNSRVEDIDAVRLVELMMTNVVGLMVCCREATKRMSTRRGGRGGSIVNVSSMAATIGGRPGASAYAASKAAVEVFTTGFAREVASCGIRVNTVRPGVVETPMTLGVTTDHALLQRVSASIPIGRLGRAEEVAQVILWLLEASNDLLTGAHIDLGGGGFVYASTKQDELPDRRRPDAPE